MVSGSCICNAIQFEVADDNYGVVQCHCSKCRKMTGSTADAMILVPTNKFKWLSGVELIAKYKTSVTSVRAFCSVCGCTLPVESGENYWVPAGVLDGEYKAFVKAHIYVGSKLNWEEIGGDAPQFFENITD